MPSSKQLPVPPTQVGSFDRYRVFKPKAAVKKAKRARFGPKRREEVKAVRSVRACLRCSLLKLKCSHHDVCVTCEQLAFVDRAQGKKILAFSGCIRTKLQEVSVFEINLPSKADRDTLLSRSSCLAVNQIVLDFAPQITWDLTYLVSDVVDWLNDPKKSRTSKVGTLSSPQFLDVVASATDPEMRSNFQLMLYAISLAYTQPTAPNKHYLAISELLKIGAVAGHSFLKALDDCLKPLALSCCTEQDLKSIFLLIFGAILAVGYSQPHTSETVPSQLNIAQKMKGHLCQILAHYLVYLASYLKLALPPGADQFLIEAAAFRWHREGTFAWHSDQEPQPDSPQDTDFYESGCSSPIISSPCVSERIEVLSKHNLATLFARLNTPLLVHHEYLDFDDVRHSMSRMRDQLYSRDDCDTVVPDLIHNQHLKPNRISPRQFSHGNPKYSTEGLSKDGFLSVPNINNHVGSEESLEGSGPWIESFPMPEPIHTYGAPECRRLPSKVDEKFLLV